jgi:hypothetical protein
MKLDYQTLKARQRKLRDTLPENVNLRAHRALSWLKAADEVEQPDAKFIFLWIAFNAVVMPPPSAKPAVSGSLSAKVSLTDEQLRATLRKYEEYVWWQESRMLRTGLALCPRNHCTGYRL